MVQFKHKKNHIYGISWEGRWHTKPNEVKNVFLWHFRNFFKDEQRSRVFSLGLLIQKKIPPEKSESIEKKFIREEITHSLNQMDPNKAPGPDGMNVAFIKEFWSLMHKDYEEMIDKFHKIGLLPQGLNSSFITLIPKIGSPRLVTDFRPISLINCSLKVLLKILANRLRSAVNGIIS